MGVGHTFTLLLVGLIGGVHIPTEFESIAESGVGVLLIVLGGKLALKLYRDGGTFTGITMTANRTCTSIATSGRKITVIDIG